MMDTVAQTYLVLGRTAAGYSVDVTYRIVGSNETWRYVEARQLTLEEAHELVESAMLSCTPGWRAPAIAGQAPLPLY